MQTKLKRVLLVLAVTIIICCANVSATDDIRSVYGYNNGSTTAYNLVDISSHVAIDNWTNVSLVTANLYGYDYGRTTQSANGYWVYGSSCLPSRTRVADGSVYYNSPQKHNDYNAAMQVCWTFSNWNVNGTTGALHLCFYNTTGDDFDSPALFAGTTMKNDWVLNPPVVKFLISGGSYNIYSSPLSASVRFHVSEAGNFTKKLSGVTVNVSSGQSGVTDANGDVTIAVLPPATTYTYGASKNGYTSLSDFVLGNYGVVGGDVYLTMSPSGLASGLTMYLTAKDAMNPAATLNGVTYSIQNTSSGVWYNSTHTMGMTVVGTGSSMLESLSQNQVIQACGALTGYQSVCSNITIPYNYYTHELMLTKNTQVAANGSWNLVVHVIDNANAQPINSATVTVITGVNDNIVNTGITDSSGVASFYNISASTTALVTAGAQGYAGDGIHHGSTGSVLVTVVPNSTQQTTIELVRVGMTYAPTSTAGVTIRQTPVPTVQPTITAKWTDSTGKEITQTNEKVDWVFDTISDYFQLFTNIVIGILMLWLLWALVYWASGGKFADAFLRRARRGKK